MLKTAASPKLAAELLSVSSQGVPMVYEPAGPFGILTKGGKCNHKMSTEEAGHSHPQLP